MSNNPENPANREPYFNKEKTALNLLIEYGDEEHCGPYIDFTDRRPESDYSVRYGVWFHGIPPEGCVQLSDTSKNVLQHLSSTINPVKLRQVDNSTK